MADDYIDYTPLLTGLPIDTSGATFVQGRWVTDVGVQWGMDDLTILFFEAKSPLLPFDDPEQNREFVEQLAFRPAECIGRMVLTIPRAEILFGLLRQAIESANASKQKQFFAQMDQFLIQQGVREEFGELIRAQVAKQEELLHNQEETGNGTTRDTEPSGQ